MKRLLPAKLKLMQMAANKQMNHDHGCVLFNANTTWNPVLINYQKQQYTDAAIII
jgi:hypothetical protein